MRVTYVSAAARRDSGECGVLESLQQNSRVDCKNECGWSYRSYTVPCVIIVVVENHRILGTHHNWCSNLPPFANPNDSTTFFLSAICLIPEPHRLRQSSQYNPPYTRDFPLDTLPHALANLSHKALYQQPSHLLISTIERIHHARRTALRRRHKSREREVDINQHFS